MFVRDSLLPSFAASRFVARKGCLCSIKTMKVLDDFGIDYTIKRAPQHAVVTFTGGLLMQGVGNLFPLKIMKVVGDFNVGQAV